MLDARCKVHGARVMVDLTDYIYANIIKNLDKGLIFRFGDGRAVLRSSVREFLCSEAMAALGVQHHHYIPPHITCPMF